MKRYLHILLCALPAVLIASCDAREETAGPVPGGEQEKLFCASSELASKAYVEGLKVLWDASDALAVYDDAGSAKADFALKSGAGTGTATFSGRVSSAATKFFAAYPGSSASAVSEGILTLTVPAEQKLVEGGRNLDPAALVGVAATTGSDLAFKNVVAAIRFNLDMDNIVSVSLKGNNEESVAGTVRVDPATGDVTEVVEGAAEAVLTPAGETFAKGQYIVTLLPGQFYRGVTLTFTAKDGSKVQRSNDTNLSIPRSKLLDLSAFINLSDNRLSFAPGQTKDLKVLSQGVSALAVHGAPEGWTVDASALGSGLLRITAPAAGTGVGAGVFDLRGTTAKNETIVSDDITVRLFGINNKAEFMAFRSLYQGDDENDNDRLNNPVTDAAVIGDYLVDGALSLNTDLAFDDEDLLLKAYIMKYLYVPVEGNGHTVTIDFHGDKNVCGFLQYIGADVRNLKLAGSADVACTAEARLAPLATLSAAKVVEVKNVTSSVALTSAGKVSDLGGLIAYVNNGTVTLDGCKFDGSVSYKPTAVAAAPAFGGLVGRVNAALAVKNSSSEGPLTLELDNRALCTADASGVGGIVGVINANKTVTFENVENKSAITVKDVNAGEVREHFAQTVGSNLAGVDVSGIAQNGSVTFEDFAGYSVTFASTEAVSLAYGASVQLPFTVSGFSSTSITGGSVVSAPAGWEIDFAHASDASPYITVKAPSQDAIKAGTAVGIGEIQVSVTSSSSAVATNVEKPVVRLYGINSKAEFDEFKAAYGPSANSPVITGLDKWLVNGEIALNTDLTFALSDFATYYIIKFLDLPLEGNNRTITYNNVSSEGSLLAFCQGLHANVSNLYFDGTMTAKHKSAEVCMLAARGINTNSGSRKATEVTLTNVHIKSTAVISYEYESAESGAYVGGLVSKGYEANSTLTLRNCSFAGTIQSIKGAAQGLGGLSGADCTGAGAWFKFYDCAFTGTIRLVQGVNKSGAIRIGGLVADNVRNSYFENCTSSGTITADMGGFVFNTSSKGSGIGGLLGYTQNKSDGSSAEFKNCSFSGSISAVNMLAAAAELGWIDADNYDSSNTFGQIVGNKYLKVPTGLETCSESGTLTYTFKTE